MAVAPSAGPTAPPRVVHLVPTALGRGSQVFARALVDELGGAAGGHQLISLFGRLEEVIVDQALCLPGKDATGLRLRALAELRRRLRSLHPDLVVAHGGEAFKYAALTTRAPVVYCVIGTWPSGGRGLARRAQRVVWRRLLAKASVAAAVSDDVAADCRKVLGVSPRRLVVIPNGRDATRYVPRADSVSDAAPACAPHLAFVGHLDAGKRPELFVRLVEELRARGLDFTASITGDGPAAHEVSARAAAANIETTGWCADVVPQLQRADVLVFPSAPDGEGMPGVLIEAGLCGVAVVATRVAGASSVVDDGATGVLVPIDDFGALVASVAALVGDQDRRKAMGAAARARCESTFALPAVASSWATLLHAVFVGDPVSAVPATPSERQLSGPS